MRWTVLLLLVLAAVVAVGRVPALPSLRDSSAQTEQNIRGVAEVLEEAAAGADEAQAVRDGLTPTKAQARWADARNAACTARANRAAALARPRSVTEIGTFARLWLAADADHDRRVARLHPPAGYEAAARRLARFDERQERGLRRVVAAAERGDGSVVLSEVGALRALAVRANPTVAELGLTACFLPTAGLPY